MKLGELIAIARECKGWSLRDLEKVCGVSNALLSQIETGKVKDPGFSTVVRICDALGISLDRAAATARPWLSALRKGAGAAGGNARAAKLSPQRRSEIASNAARIRWGD